MSKVRHRTGDRDGVNQSVFNISSGGDSIVIFIV